MNAFSDDLCQVARAIKWQIKTNSGDGADS